MRNPVDELHSYPEPGERYGGRPSTTHRPQEAPEPECHQRHIDDHESALKVLRYQAGEKASGWEGFPQAADVLLDRVGGLDEDERTKGHLESSHARQPPNGSRLRCGATLYGSQTQFYHRRRALSASGAC